MRKTITLFACLTLIGTISIVTSCKKKPEVQNAGGEISQAPTDDVVSPEDPKVELCAEGNCPCGDGFCAMYSVCIKDKCFCGAYPGMGFIDADAFASNLYGEFECVRYYEQESCFPPTVGYDFICTRPEGCKTGDGHSYPMTDQSNFGSGYGYDDNLHIARPGVDSERVDMHPDPNSTACGSKDSISKYSSYELILRDNRLIDCGKELPKNLKIIKRMDISDLQSESEYDYDDLNQYDFCNSNSDYSDIDDIRTPSDLACDMRMLCNDSGVTQDHIAEYACEIGKKYIELSCRTEEREQVIGLRCMRTEGCHCGDSSCPEHAMCKDGACKFDLYYEHRTCPDKGWDAAKSDLENYMITAKGCDCDANRTDEVCYHDCLDNCSLDPKVSDCIYYPYKDDDDNMDNKKNCDETCESICEDDCRFNPKDIEDCYEQCYWGMETTMTKTDPCQKSQ